MPYRRFVPARDSFHPDLVAATADLAKLVRRLRSLSPRAWVDRRAPVQAALNGLVALNGKLEGRRLDAPVVADHVFADAVAVIGGDVLKALAQSQDRTGLDLAVQLIEDALAKTR